MARVQLESWLKVKVDASDLVQQSMLDAHQGLDGFRGNTEAEWVVWLKQIVKHNAVDFARHYGGAQKRQIHKEVRITSNSPQSQSGPDREFSAGIQTPSQIAMQHEDEIVLASAIEKLPEDYQEVIILRNLQRLPFEEIAERMGRSGPATQMLWTRAIQKLQTLMPSPNDAG